MKKIMIVIVICVGIFVGCSSKTALDITKENYDNYGYDYALEQIKDLSDSGKYDFETDIKECYNFLAVVEHGETIDKIVDDAANN